MDAKHIRSFCNIAHIDHSEPTLADRVLEHMGLVIDLARSVEAQQFSCGANPFRTP